MEELRVLGVAGSTRQESINRALLAAAVELAPAGLRIETFDLRGMPNYDADLPQRPPVAEAFIDAIEAAQGVILVTPEYNFGVPGILKNAIDWASRPAYGSAFRDKPVGVMGAAPGVVGTARAQGQLKEILLGMASAVFPHPEYLLGSAGSRIENGELRDQRSREFLTSYLSGFRDWVAVLQSYGRNRRAGRGEE